MNLNILLLFLKNKAILKNQINSLEHVQTKLATEYEI